MGFLNEQPVAKITSAIMMIAPTIALLTDSIPEKNVQLVSMIITLAGGFLFGASTANKLK